MDLITPKVKGLLYDRDDILTPYALRSYKSIVRKSINIEGHLLIVNEMLKRINLSLPRIEKDDENKLICSLQDFCENIYACMDYLSQVLRHLYKNKYRGSELPDGFHSVLRGAEDDDKRPKEKKKPIYGDRVLKAFIIKAQPWYDIVHKIRTEETHYGMGNLKFQDDRIIYYNLDRWNKDKYIEFQVAFINDVFIHFCNYINELDGLVLSL